MEILAPAGSPDCLLAAVRCGANAVYLGGKALNARRSAANFDNDELQEATRYCHARGVKVYMTLNTIVFDNELDLAAQAIKTACDAQIDALIIQDPAVAAIAREFAPTMPLHASTQMSIHNLAGAKALERLGFSRVVLARELSRDEIAHIAKGTSLAIECFVHGALCMCVSGQCTFSAMLGGRSGNRGLCAQPCRLPFAAGDSDYALSLKDLSLVTDIPALIDAGVASFKIEGRMKRPEYVAAAVAACRRQIDGEAPDLAALAAVFSRSGFTSGYFDGKYGKAMFGMREKEDVAAAEPKLLEKLQALYREERQTIPVRFAFTLKSGEASRLLAEDAEGHRKEVLGEAPQQARTTPTTPEKVEAALAKTGGTPFAAASIACDTGEGLMLPVSAINAMRREALDGLYNLRAEAKPHAFAAQRDLFAMRRHEPDAAPVFRCRVEQPMQLVGELVEAAALIIAPMHVIDALNDDFMRAHAHKIAVELPRIQFLDETVPILQNAASRGVRHAVAGNIGAIETALRHGFFVHGDYSLNIANSLSLAECQQLGLSDATLSIELKHRQISALAGDMPRGILAYGFLPLMATRNVPGGAKQCGELRDRRGSRFSVRRRQGYSEVLNSVPLYLADKLDEFFGVDFFTLYFTNESPDQCGQILLDYQRRSATEAPITRGLYFRGVI